MSISRPPWTGCDRALAISSADDVTVPMVFDSRGNVDVQALEGCLAADLLANDIEPQPVSICRQPGMQKGHL